MRRKERKASRLLNQFLSDGSSERQAVKRRGAAADFVHQHKAAVGGMTQNEGRLGHLHHEGGTAVGQVVGCADAGLHAVDGTDLGGRGGHEAPGPGEQHNERHTAHIGRFAAHIGTGNDQHPAAVFQAAVVGNVIFNRGFYNWVTTLADVEPRAR